MRVLISDSSDKSADQIVQALAPWKGGLTWINATTGEETYDFLVNQNPDIAFVDVTNLNGISGPEAVARARKQGNKSLIILMSPLVMPQWVALATELGAYEFLRKPLNPADLESLVKCHLKMCERTHVLLVEPAPTARQILRRMLTESRFDIEVEETDNGSHAMKILALSNYNLGFVDMHLPGMGGLEVACQMQVRCPNLAVVLMSGQKNTSLASMAEKFGIGFYLNKPFFNLDLDLVLHNALKLRRTYLQNALVRQQILKKENAEKQALLASQSTA